jgi:uncharacterized protein (TIGR03067 family)
MRQTFVGALSLALVLGWSVAAEDKKPAKLTAEALIGKWTVVSTEKKGEKKSGADVKGETVEFTKDILTQIVDGKKFVMKYKLDTSKDLAVIHLEVTESPFGAGSKATGVIALDGDDVKLNYAPGETAPKAITPAKDSDERLTVLKKAK